ncbi:MAG: hypothetical protein DCC71_22880 [Proteobacteria bacterium]|nr:MAG: hypothetical protein DCC71_22880 [Pseudomonadota bacterium]
MAIARAPTSGACGAGIALGDKRVPDPHSTPAWLRAAGLVSITAIAAGLGYAAWIVLRYYDRIGV